MKFGQVMILIDKPYQIYQILVKDIDCQIKQQILEGFFNWLWPISSDFVIAIDKHCWRWWIPPMMAFNSRADLFLFSSPTQRSNPIPSNPPTHPSFKITFNSRADLLLYTSHVYPIQSHTIHLPGCYIHLKLLFMQGPICCSIPTQRSNPIPRNPPTHPPFKMTFNSRADLLLLRSQVGIAASKIG